MNIKLTKTRKLLSVLFFSALTLSCAPAVGNNKITPKDHWAEVPSFKDTYNKSFDYVGFAVEYGFAGWKTKELATAQVQNFLKKHADTITMGNEFKPQFVAGWWGQRPQISGSFKASNGVTIKTPGLKGFPSVDAILKICKDNDLKMRGHVLVWHSQTETAFFRENYDPKGKYVSKEEMTARQEWYIKTMLEHVASWEKKNNNGQHIIWAWDVVNEAVADGSSNLRSEGSDWYKIYKNYDFIVNAFRFANKYAPKDVLLCYNDYNETYSIKRAGMLRVIEKIQEAQNDTELPSRIDVMGLQSHISKNTRISDYEQTIKDFLAKGIDIHVTELDIATEEKYDPDELAAVYKNFFELFLKYRKTGSKKGIQSITIWGINDEATWLNSPDQIKWHQNKTQYPLLFTLSNDEYYAKKAYYSVIEAVNNN